MADPTTLRGGKVRVMLETSTPGTYAAPCGFNQRTVTINKGLEEVNIPDCENPDAVNWLGQDAVSLSMSGEGEGILAEESVETWLDAVESVESINARVEWEFPTKTISWLGKMQVASFEAGAQDGRRVTGNVSMQSDGKMTRTVTPATP